jgi:hypothetical protein
MGKQLSSTAACQNDVPTTMKRQTRLHKIGPVITKSSHTYGSTSVDHDLGDKATLYDVNTSPGQRTTKRLFDVESGRVPAGVQDTSYSMCAFKPKRQLAVLAVERDVESKQVPDSSGSLAGEEFDGAFITQPGSRSDGILVVQAWAVCG